MTFFFDTITKTKKGFNIYIFLQTNDKTGTFWIDKDLPIPSFILHRTSDSIVGWNIEGYFHTKKNREFLSDVKKRLIITLKDLNPSIIDKLHPKSFFNPMAHKEEHIYSLKELSKNLHSIKKTKKITHTFVHNKADSVFWEIKMHAEYLIREFNSFTPEDLYFYALEHFSHKERSTLKAKAKSIFNWYFERDFKIPKRKTGESIFDLNKKKTIRAIKKLEKIVRSTKEELSLRKWAKKADVSTHTVKKYLKRIQSFIFIFSDQQYIEEKFIMIIPTLKQTEAKKIPPG